MTQTFSMRLALVLPCTLVVFFGLFATAINPGCRCIRFTSTFGKEWGVFTSPDYPHIYPAGIRCLLYSFQAPKDSLVQVIMDSVRLPGPTNSATGCFSGDYLKLFLHLEDDGVNERTPWNSLVCGQSYNQSFYSSSRHLIIQFHSASVRPPTASTTGENLGFSARFRFLNSSQFESTGRLVPGTKCDYQFFSTNYTAVQGRFFSPHYPSTYPHNIMCTYQFRASKDERIKVVFEKVALQRGQYSCLNKTDMIRVVDGNSSRSPVIALICNDLIDLELESSGQNLQVEFIANSDLPSDGFRANFYFIKAFQDNQFDQMRINLLHQQYAQHIEMLNSGHDGRPQASTLVPQCNQVFLSDMGRNGSISSPNYPHSYVPKSHCRFELIGHGRERVQISFVDFNVWYPDNDKDKVMDSDDKEKEVQKNCDGADTLSAFVFIHGVETKILEHCGGDMPPDLLSNGHKMTVEFRARISSSPQVRGFYAHYFFIEDLAIRSGEQLLNYPCAFLYNSSRSHNGTIISPNYPGLYPRSTECHYFFHGKEREHVELHFDHLNIGSNSPTCSEESESDYLEFSNFMPVDPKFRRKCGQIDPGGGFFVRSDRKFFRVTFRSGNRYDATGFHATFHFTDKTDPLTIINVRSTSSPIARTLRHGLQLFTTVLVAIAAVTHLSTRCN